jgi:hypothetical protein
MWRGGLSRNPVGWLRQQGWQVETFNSASLRERYGRHTQRDPHDGFLAATRLAKVRRQISRPVVLWTSRQARAARSRQYAPDGTSTTHRARGPWPPSSDCVDDCARVIRPGGHRWLSGPIVIESSRAVRGRDGLRPSPGANRRDPSHRQRLKCGPSRSPVTVIAWSDALAVPLTELVDMA